MSKESNGKMSGGTIAFISCSSVIAAAILAAVIYMTVLHHQPIKVVTR